MLNFELLSQFIAFTEYGTLSAAAENLHISQPSLSRNMKHLEDELQADLFEHGKNKLVLNDTGKLALGYAKKIMDDADMMTSAVQFYERQKNTLSIGSAAPAPLWKLPSVCSSVYPGMSVNLEIREETLLLQGLLATKSYHLIILPYPLDDVRCKSVFYVSENLMFCIPKDHPLALHKTATFRDMDGESFLVLHTIGLWDRIHRRNLPHSRFIVQADGNDLEEIANNSSLPTFVTDLSLEDHGSYGTDRVNIPISDPDAHADFYFVYRKEDEKRLAPILHELSHRKDH